jgi:hypothetical protein
MFLAARLCNIGWGVLAVLDPKSLVRFADMPPLKYLEIFACLGMVGGLYGIINLEVARLLDRGWLRLPWGTWVRSGGSAFVVYSTTWQIVTVSQWRNSHDGCFVLDSFDSP